MSAFISSSFTAGGGGIGAAALLSTFANGWRMDSMKYASSNLIFTSLPPKPSVTVRSVPQKLPSNFGAFIATPASAAGPPVTSWQVKQILAWNKSRPLEINCGSAARPVSANPTAAKIGNPSRMAR